MVRMISATMLAVAILVAVASAGAIAFVATITGPAGAPSAGALSRIPPEMLALYQQAAATCPGLSWTVIAAIGTIESSNGTSTLPGVRSGANPAGAEGPMQFEPATFAAYDEPVPPGGADPPSPYDPVDAVYAAARDLCANGGAGGVDLSAAIFAYNHSPAYVEWVLGLAQTYLQQAPSQTGALARAVAVDWVLSQVGAPYTWGGEVPGAGFDCSGLVQAAYRVAGISLPRVARDQLAAGSLLPAGASLEPGDLVFFGPSPTDITHVGLVVSPGVMVDAPHPGAAVRREPFPSGVGSRWGSDVLVAATRPVG